MEREEIKELIREVLHESFDVLSVHHSMGKKEVYALIANATGFNGNTPLLENPPEALARSAAHGALMALIRSEARRYAGEVLVAVGNSGRNLQLPY